MHFISIVDFSSLSSKFNFCDFCTLRTLFLAVIVIVIIFFCDVWFDVVVTFRKQTYTTRSLPRPTKFQLLFHKNRICRPNSAYRAHRNTHITHKMNYFFYIYTNTFQYPCNNIILFSFTLNIKVSAIVTSRYPFHRC